jgi:hypothetical protein
MKTNLYCKCDPSQENQDKLTPVHVIKALFLLVGLREFVGGGEKKDSFIFLEIFLNGRRRNKKNHHHFKVLILLIFSKCIKTREFVNIQTMPKYTGLELQDDFI